MSSYQRQQDRDRAAIHPEQRNNPKQAQSSQGGQPGMWGWLESTGDWFADKYSDVSNGVNNWANGVRETTNDIWDIFNSTEFKAKDGIWNLNTDLDEITDLVNIPGLALIKKHQTMKSK